MNEKDFAKGLLDYYKALEETEQRSAEELMILADDLHDPEKLEKMAVIGTKLGIYSRRRVYQTVTQFLVYQLSPHPAVHISMEQVLQWLHELAHVRDAVVVVSSQAVRNAMVGMQPGDEILYEEAYQHIEKEYTQFKASLLAPPE